MKTVADYELEQRETFKVLEWLRGAFRDAGAPDDTAIALAEAGVDHHEFARLVEGGCDPELAARILL